MAVQDEEEGEPRRDAFVAARLPRTPAVCAPAVSATRCEGGALGGGGGSGGAGVVGTGGKEDCLMVRERLQDDFRWKRVGHEVERVAAVRELWVVGRRGGGLHIRKSAWVTGWSTRRQRKLFIMAARTLGSSEDDVCFRLQQCAEDRESIPLGCTSAP